MPDGSNGASIRSWLREAFGRRPGWMNVLMGFCAYMALVYVPWDLVAKPLALDEEVWFGVRLHGGWAKATEPLHLAIYALGAYGFWHMRPWMWPWAAVYAAQVAIAMAVWPILYREEIGGGMVRAVVFGAVSFAGAPAEVEVLVHEADRAMYAVKVGGKDALRCVSYGENQ